MKKVLLSVALLISVISSRAQGVIQFFSQNQILVNPQYLPQWPGGQDGLTAGLFLASDLNAPIGTTDFVPGTGYLNGVDVTVPGFGVGASPIFVVRVWETGKTFATSGIRGEHAPFQSPALGGSVPPNPPVTPPDLGPGFTGFQYVPEPSTYVLGALGFGALAIIRRRK